MITLLFLALLQTPIDRIVDELDSEDLQRREQAMAVLLELGAEILPDLRERLKKTTDPEATARLRHVIGEFERRLRLAELRTGPRKVTLNFDKTPVADAFAQLAKLGSASIQFDESIAGTVSTSIDGVPFFEALETLCQRSGNLSYRVLHARNESLLIAVAPGGSRDPPCSPAGAYVIGISQIRTHYPKPFCRLADATGSISFWIARESDDHPHSLELRISSMVDGKGNDLIELIDRTQTQNTIQRVRPTAGQPVGFSIPLTQGFPEEPRRLTIRGEIVAVFPHDIESSRVEHPTRDLPKASEGNGIGFRVTAAKKNEREGVSLTLLFDSESDYQKLTSRNRDRSIQRPSFHLVTRDGQRIAAGGWGGSGGRELGMQFHNVDIDDIVALETTRFEGKDEVPHPFELKGIPLD